jgi:hypothetical protein
VVADIVKSVLAGILVRERQRRWTISGTHLPPFPVTRRERARNRNVSVSSPAFCHMTYPLYRKSESIYATKDKVEGKRTTAKGFFFHGSAITALMRKFSRLSSFNQVFKHSKHILWNCSQLFGEDRDVEAKLFPFPASIWTKKRKLVENKVITTRSNVDFVATGNQRERKFNGAVVSTG